MYLLRVCVRLFFVNLCYPTSEQRIPPFSISFHTVRSPARWYIRVMLTCKNCNKGPFWTYEFFISVRCSVWKCRDASPGERDEICLLFKQKAEPWAIARSSNKMLTSVGPDFFIRNWLNDFGLLKYEMCFLPRKASGFCKNADIFKSCFVCIAHPILVLILIRILLKALLLLLRYDRQL